MKREEVVSQLTKIIQSILSCENLELHENLTIIDIEGWDSLAHINIIHAIEKNFNIKFKLMEFYKIDNIGTLLNLIEEKTKD